VNASREEPLERRAVISGIGQSAVGRRLGRTGLDLTLDACLAAVADAGLTRDDIDGLATYPGMGTGTQGFAGPTTPEVQDALRLRLGWHDGGGEGPGQMRALIAACLAVGAGLAMLRHIRSHPEIYPQFDAATAALADSAPRGITVNRAGSMMTWFFTPAPVIDYDTAKHSDNNRFKRFFHAMIERGIYLPPSQFEALFVSTAHSQADLARTVEAARQSFAIAAA